MCNKLSKPEDNLFTTWNKRFKHFLTSTNLINMTVFFGIIYFLYCLIYTSSHFKYFGIDHKMFNIPIYIYQAYGISSFISLLIGVLFAGMIFPMLKNFIFNDTFPKGMGFIKKYLFIIIDFGSAILIYLLAIKYVIPLIIQPHFVNFANIIIGAILLFQLAWKYLLNKWVPNVFNNSEINRIILIIFIVGLLLGTLLFVAISNGENDAILTVEGTKGNFIDFSWKTGTLPEEFKSMELILITYRNGNYYVVKHQKPAPNYPDVFIIPEDKIEFATISNKEGKKINQIDNKSINLEIN